jgi:hypothetical protein
MKKVKKLGLLIVLVIAAMASRPTESFAAKTCEYAYFYDAAHTQPAGRCFPSCYAGGNYCIGDVTQYYVLENCGDPCA